jgi:hypothetical protein
LPSAVVIVTTLLPWATLVTTALVTMLRPKASELTTWQQGAAQHGR